MIHKPPLPATGGYSISTADNIAHRVTIVGSDAQNTLYGAYGYLERLGFTFTSAGPTIPAPGHATILPSRFEAVDSPAFTTRGESRSFFLEP